jgi:arylsulfatase A-like enzyme
MAPHPPATPERKYADLPVGRYRQDAAMLETDVSDKPPYVQAHEEVSRSHLTSVRAAQLRSLASVDDLVDSLLDRMKQLGELKNTLIIYTSDNGFLWGEHRLTGKSVPYRPSVRVPLFVRWAGHLPAGMVDTRLVALIDLPETILGATGTPLPHPMGGIDVFDPSARRNALLLEFFAWSNFQVPTWAALISQTYEYVEYYDDQDGVVFREYYLVGDRFQLSNLLGDADAGNDPNVQPLSSLLTRARTCSASACIL